jgi:putative PIN family toxin of toxin-antitoxin system
MRPPSAVIDTNVVVSGLLTALSESPTARILDGMLAGQFRFLLSVDLLAEYRAVLLRSRIRSRHGLSGLQVDTLLTEIAASGVVLEVGSPATERERRGDRHLWRLLAQEPSAVLVTGDKRLFSKATKKSRVLTPRDFADRLEK